MTEKSLTERTVSGLGWMFTSSILRLAMRFGFFAIFAWLLTAKDYGLLGAALIVVSFSNLFSELGVSQALIQRKEISNQTIAAANMVSLVMGLAIFFLLQIVSGAVSVFFGDVRVGQVLQLLAFVYVFRAISNVSEAILTRDMKFRIIAIRDMATYFVSHAFVGIPLALFGYGVWSLVWAMLVSELLRSIVIMFACPNRWAVRIDPLQMRELLGFGTGISLTAVFNSIAIQLDNLIVSQVLGLEALGFYGRAYQLVAMPASMFGDVISRVLFPAMSSVQNDREKLKRVQIQATSAVALIAMPISVILWFLAPILIPFCLGEKWNPVVVPFQVLSLGIYFRVGYKVNDVICKSVGRVYWLAFAHGFYAVNVGIGAWLGSSYGLGGIAMGVLGALTVHFLVMAAIGNGITRLSMQEWSRSHLTAVLQTAGTIAIGVLTIAISNQFEAVPILNAFLFLLVVAATQLAGLHWVGYTWFGQSGSFLEKQIQSVLTRKAC